MGFRRPTAASSPVNVRECDAQQPAVIAFICVPNRRQHSDVNISGGQLYSCLCRKEAIHLEAQAVSGNIDGDSRVTGAESSISHHLNDDECRTRQTNCSPIIRWIAPSAAACLSRCHRPVQERPDRFWRVSRVWPEPDKRWQVLKRDSGQQSCGQQSYSCLP